jgi:hypothetical protein
MPSGGGGHPPDDHCSSWSALSSFEISHVGIAFLNGPAFFGWLGKQFPSAGPSANAYAARTHSTSIGCNYATISAPFMVLDTALRRLSGDCTRASTVRRGRERFVGAHRSKLCEAKDQVLGPTDPKRSVHRRAASAKQLSNLTHRRPGGRQLLRMRALRRTQRTRAATHPSARPCRG